MYADEAGMDERDDYGAARSLLLKGDLCVNKIAEAVGYQHEGHFFRQFRQYHQTTPQAWRKAQRTELNSNK